LRCFNLAVLVAATTGDCTFAVFGKSDTQIGAFCVNAREDAAFQRGHQA